MKLRAKDRSVAVQRWLNLASFALGDEVEVADSSAGDSLQFELLKETVHLARN
jgi:hypothetical protein